MRMTNVRIHAQSTHMEHVLPTLCVETGANPSASVIWLHGLGADGHDFEPVVPELGLPDDLHVRFVFPHAPSIPVTINGGYIMPAWYDIRQTDLGIEQDEAGIRKSARAITMLIEHEIMRGIGPERIILAGFSQGGAMALYTGLRHAERLAGIMALSAYLLFPDRLQQEFMRAGAGTPIFMAHGVEDPIVPLRLGETAAHRLEKMDYPVSWHTFPMGHSVCAEEIQCIGRWIASVLK